MPSWGSGRRPCWAWRTPTAPRVWSWRNVRQSWGGLCQRYVLSCTRGLESEKLLEHTVYSTGLLQKRHHLSTLTFPPLRITGELNSIPVFVPLSFIHTLINHPKDPLQIPALCISSHERWTFNIKVDKHVPFLKYKVIKSNKEKKNSFSSVFDSKIWSLFTELWISYAKAKTSFALNIF